MNLFRSRACTSGSSSAASSLTMESPRARVGCSVAGDATALVSPYSRSSRFVSSGLSANSVVISRGKKGDGDGGTVSEVSER